MKVRIKRGAHISQDFAHMNWPTCKPPRSEYRDSEKHYHTYTTQYPDAIFDAEWNGNYWDCRREGYGAKGDYGNGSIFVFDKDGVEIIVE